MPFISINMLEGKSKEIKRELVAKMTNLVAEVLGSHPEKIWIEINEMPRDSFAVAGKLKTDFDKEISGG